MLLQDKEKGTLVEVMDILALTTLLIRKSPCGDKQERKNKTLNLGTRQTLASHRVKTYPVVGWTPIIKRLSIIAS
jgi:hypothetical protein